MAGAVRRIVKWWQGRSEWWLQQRFGGADAADDTVLLPEASDSCRLVVKHRERRSERLLSGAVFRHMGQRIRRAGRWRVPGRVDMWTCGHVGM